VNYELRNLEFGMLNFIGKLFEYNDGIW